MAGLYPEQLLGSGPCTGHGSLPSGGYSWLTEYLISLGEIELKHGTSKNAGCFWQCLPSIAKGDVE